MLVKCVGNFDTQAMFREIDQQSVLQVISELCGFVTILSGTFLLHITKDIDAVSLGPLLSRKRGTSRIDDVDSSSAPV